MPHGPHPYSPYQVALLTAAKDRAWRSALELGLLMDKVFYMNAVFNDFHEMGYHALHDVDREHQKKIRRLIDLPEAKKVIYLRRLLKLWPESLDAELIILMAIINEIRVVDMLEIRLSISNPQHPDYRQISANEAYFHLQHQFAALEMIYRFPAIVFSANGCEVEFTATDACPGVLLAT